MGLNIKEIFSSIFKKESFKKEVLGENPSKSKKGAWETYNVSLNSNVEALAKTFKEAEKQSETETVVKQPKISLKKTKTKNPSLKR